MITVINIWNVTKYLTFDIGIKMTNISIAGTVAGTKYMSCRYSYSCLAIAFNGINSL